MLKIAYISAGDEKRNRISKKDRIRADAIATLAIRRELDRNAAKIMFANQLTEIEFLKNQLKK